jgi:DNA invertase Pin-like site-specific DNA recombinase
MDQSKRVALYARVSTAERSQDPHIQLRQLREYTHARGWQVTAEYVDRVSSTTNEPSQYKAMMEAAKEGKIDLVLLWRYDSLARSVQALIEALKQFETLGVDFISCQDNIDTTTPTGEMIFRVMASLAHFERALLSERVKAGMARAKAYGKHVARPTIPVALQQRIFELSKQGLSPSKISQLLGIAYGTVYNYAHKNKP